MNQNALIRSQLDSILEIYGKFATINSNIFIQIIIPSVTAIRAVSIYRIVCGINCTLCILHTASQFIFQNDMR